MFSGVVASDNVFLDLSLGVMSPQRQFLSSQQVCPPSNLKFR